MLGITDPRLAAVGSLQGPLQRWWAWNRLPTPMPLGTPGPPPGAELRVPPCTWSRLSVAPMPEAQPGLPEWNSSAAEAEWPSPASFSELERTEGLKHSRSPTHTKQRLYLPPSHTADVRSNRTGSGRDYKELTVQLYWTAAKNLWVENCTSISFYNTEIPHPKRNMYHKNFKGHIIKL